MDLSKMVEINITLSIKTTQPVASCILCNLSAIEADLKRFRRVSVDWISTAQTAKINRRLNTISAMPEPRSAKNPLKTSLVSQFFHRIKVEMYIYPASVIPSQLLRYHVCKKDFLSSQLASEIWKEPRPDAMDTLNVPKARWISKVTLARVVSG